MHEERRDGSDADKKYELFFRGLSYTAIVLIAVGIVVYSIYILAKR